MARPTLPVARAVQLVLSGSLLLLFLLPIVTLFLFPGTGRLLSTASDPAFRASLAFTLYASGLALGVSLAFGIPLGHLLARHRFPGRSIVESVVGLPVVVPHLVAGVGLFLLFAPTSPVGAFVVRLGVPVLETVWGVVLVMVYVSAPYLVLASQLSFRAVDPKLVESARSLGASPSVAWRTVQMPLALRGIVAGALLSWARSVSEIGGFLIVAYVVYPSGPYSGPVTNPLSVYVYFLYQLGDLAGAAAVAALFVLVAFALFLAVRVVELRGGLPWTRGELPL